MHKLEHDFNAYKYHLHVICFTKTINNWYVVMAHQFITEIL